ncbi:MmcQ/YjbR family DNA-binding protein [Heliobacterium chlorum]|uniref:MmcQ/YjbR family DNA-binding protein n=1 Tax=Heliobacterium chlorum TaxID=2698 RepID=A0ABR7T430_HELCL|nr:MmcQ/YjbR family DNA-binding protein [Heliobacterium chlorum]MBC9784311.1 MmcQ/YjbR family DNA-binding protein [Heliobacterium chlorum]
MDKKATYQWLHCYMMTKPGTEETYPFDFETTVYRVGGKMFALVFTNGDTLRVNLKCDPMLALLLREKYSAITPGYHMNKQHWNTVLMDGSIPCDEVKEMISHSYDLVFNGLPKVEKNRIIGAVFPC